MKNALKYVHVTRKFVQVQKQIETGFLGIAVNSVGYLYGTENANRIKSAFLFAGDKVDKFLGY